jgi:phosphohistidine phosphatase
MKTLILLRHAKSSWKDEALADINRPLSKRGLQDGKVIARYLAENGIAPEQILCSPAQRTKATLELLQPAFAASRPIRYEKGIYMAEAPVLLRRLRRLADSLMSVMVIGHNPGLQALALLLTEGHEDPLRSDLSLKYPTGSLAVIACAAEHWPELKPGCGHLSAFIRPKDLRHQ